MAKKANPALIGVFVLGAIILAVAGLVVFGGGKFFRQTQVWVAYFDESVKGLSIGSPVTFNGVKVGAVTDITVVVDQKEMKVRTPVLFEIEAHRFTLASGGEITFRKGAPMAKTLIERGLRAQLETQSFVTGQLGVALDLHPGTPVRLAGLSRDLPEMPTIPSSAEKISKTIENLPIDEIAQSALKAIQGVDRLVNAPEVKETIRSLSAAASSLQRLVQRVDAELKPLVTEVVKTLEVTRDTVTKAGEALEDVRKLVRNVDGQVGPMAASVEKTLTRARATLEQAQQALGAVNETVSEGSPLQFELMGTLRELSAAARSIRTLSDYLDRHPDALVFGKGAAGGK